MRTILRTVTDRVFLLGLDELYRTAMKRHESTELLECARQVASALGATPADVPIEGYYTESPELTEYFRLVRRLQQIPKERKEELAGSESFSRLIEVTSAPLFGVPGDSLFLLATAVDPLTVALEKTFPDWTIENLTDEAYKVAAGSDDYSLVGLAALSRDAVVLTALRESVVLYAALAVGGALAAPKYVWKVDPEIERRSQRFVETFNQLFDDDLPLPSPENASTYWQASNEFAVIGRCVRIGINDRAEPVRHYHWAIQTSGNFGLKAVDFWEDEVWTTQKYRKKHFKGF